MKPLPPRCRICGQEMHVQGPSRFEDPIVAHEGPPWFAYCSRCLRSAHAEHYVSDGGPWRALHFESPEEILG